MIRIFFLVLFVVSSPSAFGADLSIGDLIKACHQKTIAYNEKGERVGENTDAFCSGYLLGSLHTLVNTLKTKCRWSLVNDQTPESLLSIYLTYQKDKSIAGAVSAAPTLSAAYERAFDCRSD